MAWSFLGDRITPSADWQYSPELFFGDEDQPVEKWIRVRHWIDGRAKFTEQYPSIRVSGRIGVGANFFGLRMVSQEERIDADVILQVYRFTFFPEAELTRVAIYAPYNEAIKPRWEVQFEEWQD